LSPSLLPPADILLAAMSSIALETPLAEALSSAVHSKIVEEGWTQEDDTSLAEYIVLMLANGKTQDQIASELAGELLQDAKGTTEFAQWLFEQVNMLSNGATGSVPAEAAQPSDQLPQSIAPDPSAENGTSAIPAAYDQDMADNAPENAPRGPKGLHGGRPAGRGGRGGAGNKGTDSVLHRTRGNDRINTHSVRGVPKGPRNNQNRDVRPGMQKALNGMNMSGQPQGMPNPMMMNNGQPGQSMMTPQQQMEFMAMMEQQTRMLAQFTGMMPGAAFGQGMNQQNGQSRSLFDRVEPGRGRGGSRGRGRGGHHQNGHIKAGAKAGDGDATMEGDGQPVAAEGSPTEGEQQAEGERKPQDPSNTMCHFNLRCTNKDCAYVHQSPAAPEGTVVDMSDTCTFGAACKNTKCVAKHPSPAQRGAFQAQETCKFFPNCTKPNCPFKHPTMPLCRFGANCKTPNCQFTHLQIPCRFNPCTNLRCPYKHEPGQQKATSLADYTWTPDKQNQQDGDKEHVSDRKFVDEHAGDEELVKPEGDAPEANGNAGMREELIT